jgi:DnaT DNA-binding domain
MARMAIDDSVQRDPRITKLANLLGWSRRETLGCLVQDVWPICYDQRTAEVVAELVDLAANRDGFSAAMVESGLAKWLRGNRKVAISGAGERIAYLDHKSEAGRVGGLKSGESRRAKLTNASKQTNHSFGSSEARGNPPDPVPSPVPDPVPVVPRVRASDGSSASRTSKIPSDWRPDAEAMAHAAGLGLDADAEVREFVAHWLGDGRPKADWNQVFRARCEQLSKRRRTNGKVDEVREWNEFDVAKGTAS